MLRQAEYDELTGLYNKNGFLRYARQTLEDHPNEKFLLVRWDIDHFKVVNDMLGVETGDRLLHDMGGAIREIGYPEGLYARFDADHFVALLPQASASPEALFTRLNEWVHAYGFHFELSLHMGAYPISDTAMEVNTMCDRAALAVKSVKDSYAQRVGWYNDTLRSAILKEQSLTSEMEFALAHGQFVLYFQPQIDYMTGRLAGAETLVRWQHPQKGLIPPDRFIPLFERNGFITRLDEYVWEQSCRYMRLWSDRKEGASPVSLSVNISRVDVYRPHLCEYFVQLVRRYRLPPQSLRLEITESAYMQNSEQLIAVVTQLRAAGFTVEMDDFGAGYSSLNILKDVPVNVLKLDMRFLSAEKTEHTRGGRILAAVVGMAHRLDMEIIAEGVERKEQADYLENLGCNCMQGYYFSRPIPADDFEALARRYLGE